MTLNKMSVNMLRTSEIDGRRIVIYEDTPSLIGGITKIYFAELIRTPCRSEVIDLPNKTRGLTIANILGNEVIID